MFLTEDVQFRALGCDAISPKVERWQPDRAGFVAIDCLPIVYLFSTTRAMMPMFQRDDYYPPYGLGRAGILTRFLRERETVRR